MQYLIEAVNDSSQSKMLNFLKDHENYTLFLLGNFENYGAKLSEGLHSGNFKIIRSSDQVVGVLCLTKNGNLLIETSLREPIFETVLASCQEESIPLRGLIGNWDFCGPFWKFLKDKKIIQKETLASREILYSVDLSKISYPAQPGVRFLTKNDYAQWRPLRLDFFKEEGLPNPLNDDQLFKLFLEKTAKKTSWGLFVNDQLISIADLNAKACDLGQVGGVYTIPNFRQKGYSKSVMQQLLIDAKEIHSIRKLMIFTGEKNFAAQKLYQGLGVEQVGYYALLFGN